MLDVAGRLYAWLAGHRLVVRASSITYHQGTPPDPVLTRIEGGKVQLTDIQQVTLTAAPEDSKGFPTADTLTWTVDDPAVVSLQPSDDTLSCLCVAGNPGTATVTVSDGTISGSDAFVVSSSAVSQIVVSGGSPEDHLSSGPLGGFPACFSALSGKGETRNQRI